MQINQHTSAKQDEKTGLWKYTVDNEAFFKSLQQKKKVLKPKYHDLPRFKCITQYEDRFKNDYKQIVLGKSVKEVAALLKTFK